MKKQYTKKQIQEAINYWKKQLKCGNYKKITESYYYYDYDDTKLINNQEFQDDFAKGLSQNPPFKFDENTSDGEIVGWLCKVFDCSDPGDLIGTIYSWNNKFYVDKHECTVYGMDISDEHYGEQNVYTSDIIDYYENELLCRLIDRFSNWFGDGDIVNKDDLIKYVKKDIPDIIKGLVDDYRNHAASRDELVD